MKKAEEIDEDVRYTNVKRCDEPIKCFRISYQGLKILDQKGK